MHILYVDESGDGGLSKGSSRHLVLTGAAMAESAWVDLTAAMESVQMTHFPHAGGTLELHASPLRSGRDQFKMIPKEQRYAAIDDIYSRIAAANEDLTLFSAVVDKKAFVAQYKGRVDPYEGAFENLCTMFNYFLKRLEGDKGRAERGIIVMDQSTPALANQLRLLLARFQASGTRWDKLSHVIETPFFFDSKTSRIMQIVDFASYAVFRWYESGDDSYLRKIEGKFDSEQHKQHGLKCYPLASTKLLSPNP
jgi:hypothetical protein